LRNMLTCSKREEKRLQGELGEREKEGTSESGRFLCLKKLERGF